MTASTTILQGNGRGFGTTLWSVILHAKDRDSGAWKEHLNTLFRTYWNPIYNEIRRSWGLSVEDAEDAAQEYFTRFVEKDFLKGIGSSHGRFRAFLKASLQNHLRERYRFLRRRKRIGDFLHAPLEESKVPNPRVAERFDQEWAEEVLRHALRAVRQELRKGEKGDVWSIFRGRYLATAEVSYQALAQEHGKSLAQVKNALVEVRALLNRKIREQIRESVATEAELEAELRDLFSAHWSWGVLEDES